MPSLKQASKIIFRVILVLVLLELGLRGSGMVRNAVMSRDIIDGNTTILVLGDSISYGGNESWPKQLEAILNEEIGGYTVINRARGGWKSIDIIDRLDTVLVKYKPDMVIAMMGLLDKGALESGKSTAIWDRLFIVKAIHAFNLPSPDTPSLSRNLTAERLASLEDEVEHALLYAPDDIDLHERLRLIFIQQGRNQEADGMNPKIEELRTEHDIVNHKIALQEGHQDTLFFELITLYIYGKHYDEAILALNDYLGRFPSSEQANLFLGESLLLKKSYDEAIAHYQRLIDEDGRASYYHGLGLAYRFNDQAERSIPFFERAIALSPLPDYQFDLGLAHVSAEMDPTEAFQPLINRSYDDLIKEAILLQHDKEYVATIETLKIALATKPDGIQAFLGLGDNFERLHDYERMEEIYRLALRLDPYNGGILDVLARRYFALNMTQDMIDMYVRIDSLQSDFLVVHFRLAQGYEKLGQTEVAIRHYLLAADIEPESWEAQESFLAVSYYIITQGLPAEEFFAEIEHVSPRMLIIVYDRLAQKLELNGYDGEEYKMRSRNLRIAYQNPVTRQNFHHLAETLNNRGIPLIVMQYPILPLDDLQALLEGYDVRFISNEAVFTEALKTYSREELFTDHYLSANFGHLTPKGHRLVAENVAHELQN
ncbi:MAG: tetratricopeptide repeat protein [Nanoarchaeota archaeon]